MLDKLQTLCLYYYMQADHVLAERQASKSQLRGESEEPGPSSMSGRRVLGNGLKKAKVTVVLHVRFACTCTCMIRKYKLHGYVTCRNYRQVMAGHLNPPHLDKLDIQFLQYVKYLVHIQ